MLQSSNFLSVVALILISLHASAQVTFQPGYIITAEGEKKECYILNRDWLNNPAEIEYRESPNGEIKKGTSKDLKGFHVAGFPAYLSAEFEVDVSPSDFRNLNNDRNPVWEKRSAFLKVLVDGPAKLYAYRERIIGDRFFFSVDTTIRQLVYKQYHTADDEFTIRTNKSYLQQLKAGVFCGLVKDSELAKVDYAQLDLVRYFTDHNRCKGYQEDVVARSQATPSRKKFNLTIAPGVTFSEFFAQYGDPTYFYEQFPEKQSPRFGVEGEFIFSFQRNKWAVLVEPSLDILRTEVRANARVDYAAIEFPFGVRHYFYLRNDAAIFVNGLFVAPTVLKLKKEMILRSGKDISKSPGFAVGAGFSMGRFKVEGRVYSTADLLSSYRGWASDYKRISLIAGYRLIRR